MFQDDPRATFHIDALGRAVTGKAEAAAVMQFSSDISLRRAAWLARCLADRLAAQAVAAERDAKRLASESP